jgi:5-methylcytosine-specific restriction protein A
MLTHLINLARNATRKLSEPASRSPEWPKVEHAHLKLFPTCAACGSNKRLQVHHIRPFHLHPELELDPNNLITLCMSPNDCHILIGHGDDFKAYNPNVQTDASKVKANVGLLKEVAMAAKAARLFE